MKYIIMMVLAFSIAKFSSAQIADRGRSHWDVQINHSPSYGYGNDRYDEVERMYNRRIESIQNDPALSAHKKRRIIRAINEEKKVHLRGVRKWERKERRY